MAPDDNPAREMDDGKSEETAQAFRDCARSHEKSAVDPGQAWPHRCHDVHAVGLAGDVRHRTPLHLPGTREKQLKAHVSLVLGSGDSRAVVPSPNRVTKQTAANMATLKKVIVSLHRIRPQII